MYAVDVRLKHLPVIASMISVLILMPAASSYGQNQDTGALESAPSSCQCVSFRLDDVQDYFLNQPQMAVVQTFEEKNAGLTIGIIGDYFGEDPTLLSFLREKVSNPSLRMDVANHGWNHEDFTTFDKNEQANLLSKSNDRI